jgi:adenylylsulfate kinase
MQGRALWITGLPGSGKSTVADAVRQRHPDVVILRMDDLRKVITPNPTYSDQEREVAYRSLVYLAKTLSGLGHDVIIDATGSLRRWRDLARELIPAFAEVYLRCSLETCEAREKQRTATHGAPRDIYEKGRTGWPVPGITAPYEEPLAPEVTIDTAKVSADKAADTISRFLLRTAEEWQGKKK